MNCNKSLYIIIISITAIIICGGSFFLYKYQSLVNEKSTLEKALLEKQANEIATLRQELEQSPEQTEVPTSNSENEPESPSTAAEPIPKPAAPITVTQRIPEPSPSPTLKPQVETESEPQIHETAAIETETESESAVEVDTVPEPLPDVSVTVESIGQISYDDGYGGTYGAYWLEMRVSANNSDVYISPRTSDSTGSIIGVSYSVPGGFKGNQESEIDCAYRKDDFCYIKHGASRLIDVTVWLIPESNDDDGNYRVTFEQLHFYKDSTNGQSSTYLIDLSTASVNVDY